MSLSIELILACQFVGIAIVGFFLLRNTSRAIETRSEQLVSHADGQLKKMFLFADARRLLVLYSVVLIGVPVTLYLLGQALFIVGFSILVILLFPRVVLNIMAERRRDSFNRTLPDALAQLAGSMRAGATFTSALQSVVEEQRGALGQEFGLMLREQRLGARLEDALDNLGERVQSEELDLVISATLISQEVGGNLGDILQRLSETIRRKQEMEGKIKALTAQGVLQGIVVTLLPFIILFVLYLSEPAAITPIFTSLLGWVFLAVICILEVVGGLMIRKIVSIDI